MIIIFQKENKQVRVLKITNSLDYIRKFMITLKL